MKLNCKQGDLAIIVSSTCGNEGKIVRCLELLYMDRVTDTDGNTWRFANGPRWVWSIDRSINFGNGFDVVQIEAAPIVKASIESPTTPSAEARVTVPLNAPFL